MTKELSVTEFYFFHESKSPESFTLNLSIREMIRKGPESDNLTWRWNTCVYMLNVALKFPHKRRHNDQYSCHRIKHVYRCLCVYVFFFSSNAHSKTRNGKWLHSFFYNYFVEAVTRTRKKKKKPVGSIVDECDRWGDFKTDKHHAYSTWKWREKKNQQTQMPCHKE